MSNRKPNQTLHIKFVNPNTPEQTAKFLAKAIAQDIARNMVNATRDHFQDTNNNTISANLTY